MNTVVVRRDKITLDLRDKILVRDRYTCRYCGSKQEPFHLDHVYPVVKGGETSEHNLVTSCSTCNSKKHSSIGMWPKPIGYFEPKPNRISMITVLMLSTGVGLLWASLDNLMQGDVQVTAWFLLVGLAFCSFALGRTIKGR